MKLSCLVQNEEQLELALKSRVFRIYLETASVPVSRIPHDAEAAKRSGKELYLAFPPIYTPEAERFFQSNPGILTEGFFSGFLIRSFEESALLKSLGVKLPMISDHGLYAFNSLSRKTLLKNGFSSVTVPLELNFHEIGKTGFSGDELIAYGHLPMMITRNCIHKTLSGCDKKETALSLIDRMHNRIPVKNDCRFCLNTVLNPYPLSLLREKAALSGLPVASLRLQFCPEDKRTMGTVLRAFETVYLDDGNIADFPFMTTRGHFRRGVE